MKHATLGRTSRQLTAELRRVIVSGAVPTGEFLPSLRELCRSHELSADTVLRAMRSLEREGLIAAEPRRGYRVLPAAGDRDEGRPLAYVLGTQMAGREWTGFNRLLLSSVQSAAASRGWSLLGVGAKGVSADQAIEQCVASHAWGVLIDVHDATVVEKARRAGLAAVMVDAWHAEAGVDAVVQDGFMGGLQAGEYLAARGHREVAWVGPVTDSVHSMGRFGGAVCALRAAGAGIPEEMNVYTRPGSDVAPVLELLRRPDRPKAVLALWANRARDVAVAARELGLVPGRDFEMVGWCAEEQYDEVFGGALGEAPLPPMVVWSIAALAEAAVERLVQRREKPKLSPLWMKVPTRLRLGA